MRRAAWESSAGALVALLNGTSNSQMVMADLYTITTPGGLVLRYSGRPWPVTVNGVTWSTGPLLSRSRTRLKVGVEVDTLDVTLNADPTVQVNGVPIVQFIARRGLDDARLLLERAFAAGPGEAVVGTLALFEGRISQARDVSRLEAKLSVKSDLEVLDIKVPRNVYQPPCMNTVYDPACGLSRAANTVSGTAASGTDTARRYFTHSLAAAAGTYDVGVVTFTSGANAGISRTVRAYETIAGSGANRITVMSPWPSAVAVGDAFTITKGCTRTQAACTAFGNLSRFRGTPYVPTPESLL